MNDVQVTAILGVMMGAPAYGDPKEVLRQARDLLCASREVVEETEGCGLTSW